MKIKVLSIICLYFTLGIISSCCFGVQFPYYEFDSAQVSHENWIINNQTLGTEFIITLTGIEFVAQNNWSVFSSAYAFQPCPSDGNGGPKSPINKIDVSVNQNYFDSIPKNTSLNHLIQVGYYDENNLNYLDNFDLNYIIYSYRSEFQNQLEQLRIPKNNIDTVHVFKFEFYQENGNKTTAFSNGVDWN